MNNYNIKLPDDVQFIIHTLQLHGFEAYAVGGCVRDSILGREPGDSGSLPDPLITGINQFRNVIVVHCK